MSSQTLIRKVLLRGIRGNEAHYIILCFRLGALSDGRRPCRKGDGYLMSNNYGKTKHYNLSKCSKEWLMYYYHYANDKFWACWNDRPHPMIAEPKYPSEVMDVCEARYSRRGVAKICSVSAITSISVFAWLYATFFI